MPWLPLATSGIAYEFLVYDPGTDQDVPGFPPNVSFNEGDSTLTLAPPIAEDSSPQWTLIFPGSDSVRARVTAVSFSAAVYSGYGNAYFSYWTEPSPPEAVGNLADASGEFVSEFIPSPFEVETFVRLSNSSPPFLYYGPTDATETAGADRSWSFLLEAWVDSPTLEDPYIIRGTHRAIEGGDNPQTAWVRTEAGKLDLSGVESLTVDIQRGGHKLLTIPATGTAEGRVDFTITSANIKQKLSLLGLFRLYVRADGRVIYTGLLEVLG